MEKSKTVAELSFEFALSIISLYKKLLKSHEYVLSKQLIRAATSIGANIEEASAGASRKDFINKMAIASKEARETRYWLRLLEKSELVETEFSVYLAKIEVIIKILTKIVKTSQLNNN
ncbi:MAG TPA: four helix bundle protein [Chitinophagaceae bacterium]|nr:four helix bundle protein [Chitinophagaceae bacterium]